MVQVDWNQIRAVEISTLTDDEIENLFPMVMKCDVDVVDDVKDLRAVIKLSQEMLQYKDNQVESLLLECEELKEKVISTSTGSKRKSLEAEVIEEDNEQKIEGSPSIKHHNESLCAKNDKIKTLLLELEGIEEENKDLKEKLDLLRREMEDATDNMNEITNELNQLRNSNSIFKEQIKNLKGEKTALLRQIEEMADEQIKRDKIIDEFGAAIDVRVSEWKEILDNKDTEISNLKDQLSHSLSLSTPVAKEQQMMQLIDLNEKIDKRDKIISELESKLLESVKELNESAGMIEKLKLTNKKLEKSTKRKEQRDFLRKAHETQEKVLMLQESLKQTEDNLTIKSEQICELLDTVRRYKDTDHGLTESLEEIADLKKQLSSKTEYVQELVTIINNLEDVNSHNEMQISALRQKLGLTEDETISIKDVASSYREGMKMKNELVQKNAALEQENTDLKADVRTLKYKLNKLGEKMIMFRDTFEVRTKSLHSDRMTNMDWITEQNVIKFKHKAEMEEIQQNFQTVIEENEALRKGMHEILDSIRNQDGKSTVDVQSDTLERLLEALDVRHLAGWYHPAMRLQERLSVIQGRNAELRAQMKHLREQIQKKDDLLRRIVSKQDLEIDELDVDMSEGENENVKKIIADMERLQLACREEYEQWKKEKESLQEENNELKEVNEELKARLEIYETDLKAIEAGEDETKKAFAERTKECAEVMVNLTVVNRKCSMLENLLSRESSRIYQMKKDEVAAESAYKKIIADMDKQIKLLESQNKTLENNLLKTVNIKEYNQLKEQYEESKLRFRAIYELHLALNVEEDSKEDFKNSTDRSDSAIDSPAPKLKEDCMKNVVTINSQLQEQLINFQNNLFHYLHSDIVGNENSKTVELQEELETLKIENENLMKTSIISHQEAKMHYTINSFQALELDNLRHQIIDLQAISEDKETIARLGFELNNSKALEIEIDKQRLQLQTEINQLRCDLEIAVKQKNETKTELEELKRHYNDKCRISNEIISFLQTQYAGSTSVTLLQRYEEIFKEINNIRRNLSKELQEAKEKNNAVKLQNDILLNRLAMVDHLKDMLEQQIGNSELQSIMHRFSKYSQCALNDYRYKRQTAQLATELQITNIKLNEYESIISQMECEMMNFQKIWQLKSESIFHEREIPAHIEVSTGFEKKSVSIEAKVDYVSVDTQSDPILEPHPATPIISPFEISNVNEIETTVTSQSESTDSSKSMVSFLQEQLRQALALASERSTKLIKYESQITEYKTKLGALDRALIDKDNEIVEKNKLISLKSLENTGEIEGSDKVALKSTINSLQQIVTQKEETITRYQNLLKEDRDEHIKVVNRLQEEIKNLNIEISTLKTEEQMKQNVSVEVKDEHDNLNRRILNESKILVTKADIEGEEKIARLEGQVSTLEADLDITRTLTDRWRRLAEERLQHMDEVREKLEAQHKNELESYRAELNKWQDETSALRQQLSENRMKLTKGNISLSKELQEKDLKIEELTATYQQLQNDFEMIGSMGHTQQYNKNSSNNKMVEPLHVHESQNLPAELDLTRRQYKSMIEKEKLYKDQILDLKQQLSRRYMAEKTEERRVSQREIQLEKKLKNMEEELNKARLQLDHEYRAQEAKRAKTAEELSLWEKQKKWQQTAEKLKKDLKEKTDQYKKLIISYDKLKAVVTCMEREKWYLRSKLKSENSNYSNDIPGRSVFTMKIVEDLQVECQTLRDRITDLTNRSESEDTYELKVQIEKQKQRIAALEFATQGNSHIVDQLEKVETIKSSLEKENLRLESENFELRMNFEKVHGSTPRLKEKVEHLERYVELLKMEKSSDTSDRSSRNEHHNTSKKSLLELERTIFVLKRIVEKLQTENKRLRLNAKNYYHPTKYNSQSLSFKNGRENSLVLKRHYEHAKKRVVALETDLQLAEQRIAMLEKARSEEENTGIIAVLKQQLAHKSELLDKVKQLLHRAAMNEKILRQKIQQIELKQTLTTIPEYHTSPSQNS